MISSGIFAAMEVTEVWITGEGEFVLCEFNPFIESWLVTLSDDVSYRISPDNYWNERRENLDLNGWHIANVYIRQVLAA